MKKQYYSYILNLGVLIILVFILFIIGLSIRWLMKPSSTPPPPLSEIPEQYPIFIFDNGSNSPVLPVPGGSSGRLVKIAVEIDPSEVYFYYQGSEARNEPYNKTIRFEGTLEIDNELITEPRDFLVLLMGGAVFVTGEDGALIVFEGAGAQAWIWEIELDPGVHVATFRIFPADTNARGHDLLPLEFSWYFTVIE